MQVSHYLSASGRDPLQRWLDGLGDLRCRLAVLRRIDRLARDRILLLGGGSKSTQRADIAQAAERLRDYGTRS